MNLCAGPGLVDDRLIAKTVDCEDGSETATMPKTLLEYADSLDDRKLMWPAAPKVVPAEIEADAEPLNGIRGVLFNVYGTLLRIADGQLYLVHPQTVRMEIALEKTIKEFNMWQSMTRKPGAPSEAMLPRYQRALDDLRLAPTATVGDQPEISASRLWLKLILQLQRKGYNYDESTLGDEEDLSEKVAYFFHSCLQGLAAADGALDALRSLAGGGMRLGLLADAQCFTAVQMLRAFRRQGTLRSLDELFDPALMTFSYQEGIRKPSKSLYRRALDRLRRMGVSSSQVLYVGTWLRDDLAVAKGFGMQTALLAADRTSIAATAEDLADPELRPDRILTGLSQIRTIVGQ